MDVGRRLERQSGRGVGVEADVAGLDLGEERLVPAGDVMGGDGREEAARSESVGDLADAHGRVDPVERGRGQDEIERLRRERPVLERRVDHVDRGEAGEVASGEGGQVGTELHGDDPTAPLGQRPRGLPCAGPDLQHPGAGPDRRQLGQVVEQPRRVARPRPVVPLGVLVEGQPEHVPIVLGHAPDPLACVLCRRRRGTRARSDAVSGAEPPRRRRGRARRPPWRARRRPGRARRGPRRRRSGRPGAHG